MKIMFKALLFLAIVTIIFFALGYLIEMPLFILLGKIAIIIDAFVLIAIIFRYIFNK